MLEAKRVFQVCAHRDELRPVNHELDEPRPHDLRVLQFWTERDLELNEDLLFDPRYRSALDRRRGRDDGAHIWMTSSFLSAYWVATYLIPRNGNHQDLDSCPVRRTPRRSR